MFDERKYAGLVAGLASKVWARLPVVGGHASEEDVRAAASDVVSEYPHGLTFMEAASILDLSNNSEAGFKVCLDSVVFPYHTKSFVVDAAEAALVEDVTAAVFDLYVPGAAEEPVSTLEEDIAALASDMRERGRVYEEDTNSPSVYFED